MLQDIKNKKIFVYSLTGIATGGCELLHQLVGYLNDNGREAYIVYDGFGLDGDKSKLIEAYKCYNVKVATEVPDTEDTLVVLDEGFLYLASQFKRAKLFFWWLSVDNYFIDPIQLPFLSWCDMKERGWEHLKKSIKVRLHYLKARMTSKGGNGLPWYPIVSLKQLAGKNCVSGYQSEYARLFLEQHGFKHLVPLSDYINTEFAKDYPENQVKEDIVLYNPKKGFEYTQKLIAADKTIKWVPLINLTRTEMLHTLQRAKIYVDFGYHPGKDRIPREAAINRCCVITGRRGAAANPVDIMIPEHFKINERRTPVNDVVAKIHYVFDNYDKCFAEQSAYREKILGEKDEFFKEIDNVFDIK